MIATIAWRNLWRNRTRTMVVVGAIVIGVWAVIFMTSFSTGIVRGFIRDAIENEISHIQIHQKDYLLERDPNLYIKETDKIKSQLNGEHIRAYSTRSMVFGMLSSVKGARGMRIKGVDPNLEQNISKLDQKIISGEYFLPNKKNQILISERTANKQKLKVRSKVILTFQTIDGEITAGAFRIRGIFKTGSGPFDETVVFVNQKDLNRLLGNKSVVHEIAVLVDSPNEVKATQLALSKTFPNHSVKNYKEISPDIELYESQIYLSSFIFTVIVMLALVFGIINTMLMAVLERIRELGMLMAVGMNRTRVFLMIVFETICLALVGMPIGICLGLISVWYFGKRGIDLSNYSEGMQEFGFSAFIYPELDGHMYLVLALIVVLTAILASIYPARKAIKLKPVEAIRKV